MALTDIFRSHYWDSCSLRFSFLQISQKLLAFVLSVSPASCWLTCCEWLGNTCRCCSWHRQLGTVTWCWCGCLGTSITHFSKMTCLLNETLHLPFLFLMVSALPRLYLAFLQGIHSPSLHLVYDFSRLCSHTSVCLFVIISNHDLFLFKGRTKLSCHLFVLKQNLSLVVEVMQHEMGFWGSVITTRSSAWCIN